jgi:hypothetical protein
VYLSVVQTGEDKSGGIFELNQRLFFLVNKIGLLGQLEPNLGEREAKSSDCNHR